MQNWQGGPPQGGGYQQGGPAPQQGGYGQPQQGMNPQQGMPQQGMPQQGMPQQGMGMGNPLQGPSDPAAQGKGFVRALFDFSFRTGIGPLIIKLVFGLVCLGAIGTLLLGLYNAGDRLFGTDYRGDMRLDVEGAMVSLVAAVFSPVVSLVVGRLFCEVLASVFRIADNLQEMNDRQKRG